MPHIRMFSNAWAVLIKIILAVSATSFLYVLQSFRMTCKRFFFIISIYRQFAFTTVRTNFRVWNMILTEMELNSRKILPLSLNPETGKIG